MRPAAPADYLMTDNTKHFPTSWTNVRIVMARRLPDGLLADKSCRIFEPGPPERSRRGPSIDPPPRLNCACLTAFHLSNRVQKDSPLKTRCSAEIRPAGTFPGKPLEHLHLRAPFHRKPPASATGCADWRRRLGQLKLSKRAGHRIET